MWIQSPLWATAQSQVNTKPSWFWWDVSWRTRVSEITTLFDWKTLGADDSDLWDNKWTWTFTFQKNKTLMEVQANQYCVRQSKIINPYFSWKTQLFEMTWDTFAPQSQIIKKVWYFSSSFIAPYEDNLDWTRLESNGNAVWTDLDKIFLKCVRNWVELLNISARNWLNTKLLKQNDWAWSLTETEYNWDDFTVYASDFLWLWWAWLRASMAIWWEIQELHNFSYAGSGVQDVFMENPNQPLRYEIRSTGWVWSFRAICNFAWSEWSYEEAWVPWVASWNIIVEDLDAPTAWNPLIRYALVGMKMDNADECRHKVTKIVDAWTALATNNDPWIFELWLNPQVAGTFAYNKEQWIEIARAVNKSNTITGWRIVLSQPSGSFGGWKWIDRNYLDQLLLDLDGVPSTLVLTYAPFTANQKALGIINFKQY